MIVDIRGLIGLRVIKEGGSPSLHGVVEHSESALVKSGGRTISMSTGINETPPFSKICNPIRG